MPFLSSVPFILSNHSSKSNLTQCAHISLSKLKHSKILQATQNPLKAFKQTSQKSTLTNNHIQNSNYLKTFQVCPQTLKSDPLNSKQLQTVQISLCSLATLKSDPLEA